MIICSASLWSGKGLHVLLQAFYVGKQYRRALALLRESELVEADIRCRYLAARCLAEIMEWDECLNIMGGPDPSDADMLGMQVQSIIVM